MKSFWNFQFRFALSSVITIRKMISITIIYFLAFITNFTQSSANAVFNLWSKAMKQSTYEQEVEDFNSLQKFDNFLVRRLIVMPLTEVFNPNQVSAMHGKVQYGDKCSLPSSLGKIIFEKPYEVPWLFEMIPLRKDNKVIRQQPASLSSSSSFINSNINIGEQQLPNPPLKPNHNKILNKAYISPLDFRSPENYIFLPKWLMTCLDLKPNDIVEISFVRIKLASLVVLQPLTLSWDQLLELQGDPKSLLEHEINKYSSITAGSTIAIEIKGHEYPIYVKEVKAEGGVSVKGVRVQDSDVKVDIDRQYLDDLIQYQKLVDAKEKSKLLQDKMKESRTKSRSKQVAEEIS